MEELPGHFEEPAEYLAAMHSIGWTPLAMFYRTRDGKIICMGVNETAPTEEAVRASWRKLHAISMRMPVQLPADRERGTTSDWWDRVWQHLYDRGLRQDVTPKQWSWAWPEEETS